MVKDTIRAIEWSGDVYIADCWVRPADSTRPGRGITTFETIAEYGAGRFGRLAGRGSEKSASVIEKLRTGTRSSSLDRRQPTGIVVSHPDDVFTGSHLRLVPRRVVRENPGTAGGFSVFTNVVDVIPAPTSIQASVDLDLPYGVSYGKRKRYGYD